MLTKFAVKNYRGFAERIEWNLANPNNYSFNNYAIKEGIVKNGIIYGPNGSGKSNFALALFDIILHLTQKNKDRHQVDTIVNVYHPRDYVAFEYTFRFGTTEIEYNYAKSENGIETEQVVIDGEIIFSLKGRNLDIKSSEFPMPNEIKKQLVQSRDKVSVLGYLWSVYPLKRNHPLLKMKDFIEGMLLFWSLQDRGFVGFEIGGASIEECIIKNGWTEDFACFLKEVSGQEYRFMPPNINVDKMLICDMGVGVPFHKICSTGTSSLTLLYYWIKKMQKASFVMIDEFDAFYHFDLSFKVCQRLFESNNQVFVTSHNTYLMNNDLLRPDCNFIIDKNYIKPLCDCTEKELRFGNSMEKMYRGNAFNV